MKAFIKKIEPGILISLILFLPMINGNLAELLTSYGLESLSEIIYPLLLLISLFSYFIVLLRKPVSFVIILAIISVIVVYSSLLNNTFYNYLFDFDTNNLNSIVTSYFFTIFVLTVPILLLLSLKININVLLLTSYKIGVLNLIIFIWAFVRINFLTDYQFNYMSIAYSTLPSVFICYFVGKDAKKTFSLLLSIVASCLIVIGGSRGSLISLIVFMLLEYLFLKPKKITLSNTLQTLLILLITLFFVVNFNQILNVINNFTKTLGYNSRIIDSVFLFDGGFLDYSTRFEIQKKLVESINSIGYGLFGDRVISMGDYSHNWILELILSFGVLFGLPMALLVIYVVVKGFLRSRKINNNYSMFFMLYSITMLSTKFLVSATFLRNPEFWFLVGMSFYIGFKKKL